MISASFLVRYLVRSCQLGAHGSSEFISGMNICRMSLISHSIRHLIIMVFSKRKPCLLCKLYSVLNCKVIWHLCFSRNVLFIFISLWTAGSTVTYFFFLRLSYRCNYNIRSVTLPENCTIQGPTTSPYPSCCPEAVCTTRFPWQFGDIYEDFVRTLP